VKVPIISAAYRPTETYRSLFDCHDKFGQKKKHVGKDLMLVPSIALALLTVEIFFSS
jgi:hypothetical protein